MTKKNAPLGIYVHLKQPHDHQRCFLESAAKRKIARAGRRGGKTTVAAAYAVERFMQGRRVLYAVPTSEQVDRFWIEVNLALADAIQNSVFESNLTTHTIALRKTRNSCQKLEPGSPHSSQNGLECQYPPGRLCGRIDSRRMAVDGRRSMARCRRADGDGFPIQRTILSFTADLNAGSSYFI
jgi:hypothetical protein